MDKQFRNLRVKLWLRILAMVAVMILAVALVFYILADIVFQDALAALATNISNRYGINVYSYAIIYKKWVLLLLMVIGAAAAIYIGLGRFSYYLNHISDGVRQVFSDRGKPIVLPDELKEMETNLNTIRYDLKQRELEAKLNEQQKNDLIVYLAHDLKTPLTSIIGYLSLIEESNELMTEAQKDQFAHIAFQKSQRLKVLVDELFEITRFNAKNIPLMRRQIPLHYLLTQLFEEFYPLLKEKNLTYRMECAEDIMLTADGDQLGRVFDNILRNAVCYSDADTEISVVVTETGDEVTLAFTNHGIIISEDQLEHIFDKFYRVDEARTTNSGGAGLGLAIAKIIVELHGGTITATSDSSGTCFLLRFPKELSQEKGA